MGELRGVAQQVEEDLTGLGDVGDHRAQAGEIRDLQPVAVARDQRMDRGHGARDHLRHVEALAEDLHLAGLDLRDVEDVVDQAQQVAPGGEDLLEVGDEALLAQVVGLLLEHLAVADDGVERRAQLVAHVGQEGALGAVRGHRLVARERQLALGLLEGIVLPGQLGRPLLHLALERALGLLERAVRLAHLVEREPQAVARLPGREGVDAHQREDEARDDDATQRLRGHGEGDRRTHDREERRHAGERRSRHGGPQQDPLGREGERDHHGQHGEQGAEREVVRAGDEREAQGDRPQSEGHRGDAGLDVLACGEVAASDDQGPGDEPDHRRDQQQDGKPIEPPERQQQDDGDRGERLAPAEHLESAPSLSVRFPRRFAGSRHRGRSLPSDTPGAIIHEGAWRTQEDEAGFSGALGSPDLGESAAGPVFHARARTWA